jgi:phage baseplate assembly protein W
MKGIKYYNKDFFVIDSDETLAAEYLTRALSTSPGEMVNKPDFGSKVKGYLFEYNDVIMQDIEREIQKVAEKYIPNFLVSNIQINSDQENHTITIVFDLTSKTTGTVSQYSQTYLLAE